MFALNVLHFFPTHCSERNKKVHNFERDEIYYGRLSNNLIEWMRPLQCERALLGGPKFVLLKILVTWAWNPRGNGKLSNYTQGKIV